jgi:hypothetical protein
MSKRTRRTHTPALKAKVALAAIRCEHSISTFTPTDHAVEIAASGRGCRSVRVCGRRRGQHAAASAPTHPS